jgi:hypothetical protein
MLNHNFQKLADLTLRLRAAQMRYDQSGYRHDYETKLRLEKELDAYLKPIHDAQVRKAVDRWTA